MKLEPVKGLPTLHTTPLARVSAEETSFIVEVDDTDERRWRISFEPYQAGRVTTSDCFLTPGGLSIIPQTVVEVVNSEWLKELEMALEQIDSGATFLEKAHHYLLPLQDEFVEVVAWGVKSELVEEE